MQSESILTNNVILDVLQRLYFSETKPAKITPLDLSVLTYLILRRSIDHELRDSHNTIAERVGIERKAIIPSLKRLENAGWITVSGKGRGQTKGISINIETFPAAQLIRDKITPEAKRLAGLYFMEIRKLPQRKKLPKNWIARQYPSAQRILTHCGGNLDLACEVVGTALKLPNFNKRASVSLYHVLTIWKPLYRAYTDAKESYMRKQQEPTNQKGEKQ